MPFVTVAIEPSRSSKETPALAAMEATLPRFWASSGKVTTPMFTVWNSLSAISFVVPADFPKVFMITVNASTASFVDDNPATAARCAWLSRSIAPPAPSVAGMPALIAW